jgi:hypothetical protein
MMRVPQHPGQNIRGAGRHDCVWRHGQGVIYLTQGMTERQACHALSRPEVGSDIFLVRTVLSVHREGAEAGRKMCGGGQ